MNGMNTLSKISSLWQAPLFIS